MHISTLLVVAVCVPLVDRDLVVGFNANVRLKERPGLLVVVVEGEA